MPLPNQYCRATLLYRSVNGNFEQLVLWYFPVGSVTIDQSVADQLASGIDAACGASLAAVMASNAQYYGTKTSVNDSGVIWTSSSTAAAAVGGVASDSSPDFVCAVLRKKSSVPGRSGQGRWRVGCVPETYTVDNLFTVAALGAYNAVANVFKGDRTASLNTWKAVHHSQKNVTLTEIIATSVDPNPGRISRREVRSLL